MLEILKRIGKGQAVPPKDSADRTAVGKFSGIVGILCNAILFAGKLAVGLVAGSVAVLADALNNLTDAASALVTLWGFKLAEKPADSEHPYGHARYEYLTALAVAAMILIIGFELAKASFEKILHPGDVRLSLPMLLLLVLSVLLKLWMCWFNRKLGRAIDSGALLAVAEDSRNDAIATAVTLIAAFLQWRLGWQVDGVMGLGVALFILYSGIKLGKETISPLLGEAASPALCKEIAAEATADSRILGYHDLMVHDYGPMQRFGSIHVEMDSREDPLVCHGIIDAIERACLEKYRIHLVVHYDPVVTHDPEHEKRKAQVAEILARIDTRLTFHDLRLVGGEGKNTLVFDIALPVDMAKQEQEIRKTVETALIRENGDIGGVVITFDLA